MCMRPCGPVRHHRGSRRTASTKDIVSVIYPTASNIILSREGQVKVGSHVIGEWYKEEAYEGGFHFRPVYSHGGKVSYAAKIHGKGPVNCSRKKDLYGEIADLCKDGFTLSK